MKSETMKAAVELDYTLRIVRKNLENLRKQDGKEKKITIPMTGLNDTVFDQVSELTRWMEAEEAALLTRIAELKD